MQEWQQIKADLDAGITPDIDSLKTSVDQLLGDLEEIEEQLEKLSVLINATATASTTDDFGLVGEPNQATPVHGEIVFYRQSEGHDIWIMDSDGKNQRRLTTHPATDSFPAWSHDGQRITSGSSTHVGTSFFPLFCISLGMFAAVKLLDGRTFDGVENFITTGSGFLFACWCMYSGVSHLIKEYVGYRLTQHHSESDAYNLIADSLTVRKISADEIFLRDH